MKKSFAAATASILFASALLLGCSSTPRSRHQPGRIALRADRAASARARRRVRTRPSAALGESYKNLSKVLRTKKPDAGTFVLEPTVTYKAGGPMGEMQHARYTLEVVVRDASVDLVFDLGPDVATGGWAPASEIPYIRASFDEVVGNVERDLGAAVVGARICVCAKASPSANATRAVKPDSRSNRPDACRLSFPARRGRHGSRQGHRVQHGAHGVALPHSGWPYRAGIRLMEELSRSHPEGIGVLQVVEVEASPPEPQHELLSKMRWKSRASGTFRSRHEGSGFKAASVRAIVWSVHTLARPTFPHAVHDSVADAARWAAGHNQGLGRRDDARTIERAVQELRRVQRERFPAPPA